MNYLENYQGEAHMNITKKFPEWLNQKWSGAWFDTEAMNVDLVVLMVDRRHRGHRFRHMD